MLTWGSFKWLGGHEKGVFRTAHTRILFSGSAPPTGLKSLCIWLADTIGIRQVTSSLTCLHSQCCQTRSLVQFGKVKKYCSTEVQFQFYESWFSDGFCPIEKRPVIKRKIGRLLKLDWVTLPDNSDIFLSILLNVGRSGPLNWWANIDIVTWVRQLWCPFRKIRMAWPVHEWSGLLY